MQNNNQAYFTPHLGLPWNPLPPTLIPNQWCQQQQFSPNLNYNNGFHTEHYLNNGSGPVYLGHTTNYQAAPIVTASQYFGNFPCNQAFQLSQPQPQPQPIALPLPPPPPPPPPSIVINQQLQYNTQNIVIPVIENVVVQDNASKNEARTSIREHEELARKSLLLKKKELKWKLMQASQSKNRAQLEEIRVEANYNKRKMMKIMSLAHKLRTQYVKVARAAKVAESLSKKSELQLETQEKFVADEKMQLTKLEVDCRKIGNQLYGPEYKLAINSDIASEENKQRLTLRLEAARAVMRSKLIEFEKRASINSPAKKLLAIAKSQAQSRLINKLGSKSTLILKSPKKVPLQISNDSEPTSPPTNESIRSRANLMKKLSPFLRKKLSIQTQSKDPDTKTETRSISTNNKPKQPAPSKLSFLYDTKDSVLYNLASYRLTTRFAETGRLITDINYTHNICPNDYICLPDLMGTCTDKNCLYQHKSNYFMPDIDKLADILSYKPSLTGFKPDPNLSNEENNNICRLKLKQYAAKLLAKNSDKSVEAIAQNLVKYVRANKSDHELLELTRELPKVSHQAHIKVSVETLLETDEK